MTNTEREIREEFEECKGQIVLMHGKVARLVAIGDDGHDFYWITFDGHNVDWTSCLIAFIRLKDRIDDKDYEKLTRECEFNHWDQPLHMFNLDQPMTTEQLHLIEKKRKAMMKAGENDRYLAIHWDIN